MNHETLLSHLAGLVAQLRSSVTGATVTNWRSLVSDSEAKLREIESLVELGDPLLTEAFQLVRDRCRELADQIGDKDPLAGEPAPAIENARQWALVAIGELSDRLEDARPSGLALGTDLSW